MAGAAILGEASRAAQLFAGGTVLCDGAMGSMLYGRGVFINRCYDELNVSQPELVRAVHTEYLQAGAGGDRDEYVWREPGTAGTVWAGRTGCAS